MSKVKAVLAYFCKNIGLLIGVVEEVLLAVGQVIKSLAGLANITTFTRKDDAIVNAIETYYEEKVKAGFDKVKAWLYGVADKVAPIITIVDALDND